MRPVSRLFHSAPGKSNWPDACVTIERFTPGLKYEHVTISSGIWRGVRAGDAVAGTAVIGATENAAGAAADSRATATASALGTSSTAGAGSRAVHRRSAR